jgi:hypothetical protein
MNWNTLEDGLTDPAREQSYRRILQAVKPDVIGFNEVWDATASEIRSKLNSMIPLQNNSWNTVKLDAGNIIASRYPVLQSWIVYSGQRITASLIDVPDRFGKDFLVINCHYKCCGGASNDATRQREADATIAFLLDAKSPGGVITLPQNTPFVIMGDLNFVGERQQLKTLLTGEIINTQLFGNGGKPDWDNTDLEDLISMQSDKRTALYQNFPNPFNPKTIINYELRIRNFVVLKVYDIAGREVATLVNDIMPAGKHAVEFNADRSFERGLLLHTQSRRVCEDIEDGGGEVVRSIRNYDFRIRNVVLLKVYDIAGREVATLVNEIMPAGKHAVEFNAKDLSSGVYFYTLRAGEFEKTLRMVVVR